MMKPGAEVVEGGTWFRVWAPLPRTLALLILDGRAPIAMPRDGRGHAERFVPGVGAGARYVYLLDGERRRPDPGSRFQPEGVHGPSQVVDPRAHRWTDGDWRPESPGAIYELHVGAFSPAG